MFVCIIEYFLILCIMLCLNEGVVNNDKNSILIKLILNINMCGVCGGNFEIRFDGLKLELIFLNVIYVEIILVLFEVFILIFLDILDGVVDEKLFV